MGEFCGVDVEVIQMNADVLLLDGQSEGDGAFSGCGMAAREMEILLDIDKVMWRGEVKGER